MSNINIRLELAKRATELIQEKEQDISYLNINAAISKASREFESKEKTDYEILIHGGDE